MYKNLFFLFSCFYSFVAFGNDTAYVARQENYIESLKNAGGNTFTLKAFEGEPIDSVALYDVLADLPTKFNPDFQIVELVRVLFYADSIYDDDILPVLDQMPFWFNKGDTIRNYWTENHMIMWMSSEWLLHEKYGREVDATLYPRLKHYLDIKLRYGFYEFFSSVYNPYTLSGLLNLYEFTEDAELKEQAKQVAQLLLKQLLIPTTDLGVYFPAAGRNYPEKLETAYGQNHNSLIYLLTGKGETPTYANHAGAFLATSTLPVDDVISSWRPKIDEVIEVGHSLKSSFLIHKEMSPLDQVVFQWSASSYAHPDVIEETMQLLADSVLWGHKDWESLKMLSFVQPQDAPNLAEEFSVLSYGSTISGYDVNVFKNNSISLMSIENLWKGKIGYQQSPFVASVGTTAVYTAAGKVNVDWNDRDKTIENTHMPHVSQKSNLALIMYRPEQIPETLLQFTGDQFTSKEVGLFWKDENFDEVVEGQNWLLGRQDENYIAVRRSCIEKVNTWWTCDIDSGQTWVVMVGDDDMYGDFDNFKKMIAQSTFKENWYHDYTTSENVYHAQITVDTLMVEYKWGVSEVLTRTNTPINFEVYPNPSSKTVTLNLNTLVDDFVRISVYNTMGTELYFKKVNFFPFTEHTIEIGDWPIGLYHIVIESKGKYYHQKLVRD